MKIMSIDPSIMNTGVVILNDKKVSRSYTFRTKTTDRLEKRIQQISEHFDSLEGIEVDVALIEMPEAFMRKSQYNIKNVKSIQLLMMSIGAIVGAVGKHYHVELVRTKDWKGSTKKAITKMIADSLTDALNNEHERDAYVMAINWQDSIRFRQATPRRRIDRFMKQEFID